jgi:AcrR family transcriptional regulator
VTEPHTHPARPPVEVARYLQLMWGVEAPGRRGPKPGRSIQEIGEAAVTLADREGLGAVSMKAVAQALGLTTMSLYRYVDSKDELYAVMLDIAYGPPDMSLTARGGWRRRLERWARAIAAVRLAHPWTVLIPLTEPPATPNATAWTECGLQAFSGTKLSAQQQLSSMLLVDGYVQHHIRQSLQLGFISETGESQDGGDDYPQNLAQLVDPVRFPRIVAAAQEAMMDDDEDFFETELDFGLRTILDGVAQLVARTS